MYSSSGLSLGNARVAVDCPCPLNALGVSTPPFRGGSRPCGALRAPPGHGADAEAVATLATGFPETSMVPAPDRLGDSSYPVYPPSPDPQPPLSQLSPLAGDEDGEASGGSAPIRGVPPIPVDSWSEMPTEVEAEGSQNHRQHEHQHLDSDVLQRDSTWCLQAVPPGEARRNADAARGAGGASAAGGAASAFSPPARIFRRGLQAGELERIRGLLDPAFRSELHELTAREFEWALSISGHAPGSPAAIDSASALTALRQLTYLNGLPALDAESVRWFLATAQAGRRGSSDSPGLGAAKGTLDEGLLVVLEEFQSALLHLLHAALRAPGALGGG